MPNPQEGQRLMAATILHLPTLPANDTSPEYPEDIMAVARVMLTQGITPANLAGCPHLTAAYAAPLAALIAARDLARTLRDANIGITPEVLRLNAAAQPDLADLYNGAAEALELLEATP